MPTFIDDDNPKTVGLVTAVIVILSLLALLTAGCAPKVYVVGPSKAIHTSFSVPKGVHAEDCRQPEFWKLSNGRTMIYLECSQRLRKRYCDVFYGIDAKTGKVLDKVRFCEDLR